MAGMARCKDCGQEFGLPPEVHVIDDAVCGSCGSKNLEPGNQGYGMIWWILLVLTLDELGVGWLSGNGWLYPHKGVAIALLMLLAVVKAALVAMYFMHLRFEGRVLRFLAVAPLVLVMVVFIGLWPDLGLRQFVALAVETPAQE